MPNLAKDLTKFIETDAEHTKNKIALDKIVKVLSGNDSLDIQSALDKMNPHLTPGVANPAEGDQGEPVNLTSPEAIKPINPIVQQGATMTPGSGAPRSFGKVIAGVSPQAVNYNMTPEEASLHNTVEAASMGNPAKASMLELQAEAAQEKANKAGQTYMVDVIGAYPTGELKVLGKIQSPTNNSRVIPMNNPPVDVATGTKTGNITTVQGGLDTIEKGLKNGEATLSEVMAAYYNPVEAITNFGINPKAVALADEIKHVEKLASGIMSARSTGGNDEKWKREIVPRADDTLDTFMTRFNSFKENVSNVGTALSEKKNKPEGTAKATSATTAETPAKTETTQTTIIAGREYVRKGGKWILK